MAVDVTALTDIVDEKGARRILATARSIAPGLDVLVGEPLKDAIAILQGVAEEYKARGSRIMKSQSRNGTSITLADVGSMFSPDDRSALRGLCAASNIATGGPLGSFPTDRPLSKFWPETTT